MLIVAPYHLQENTSELFAVGSSLWFGCLSQSTHPLKKDGPSHVILTFFLVPKGRFQETRESEDSDVLWGKILGMR